MRDILRTSTRDSELQVVSMGQLTDMSGTNDAFNSSICSLEVCVPHSSDNSEAIVDGSLTSEFPLFAGDGQLGLPCRAEAGRGERRD